MKKVYISVAVILLILILTNPSVKSFKEFKGYNSYSGLKRESNFFVFSVFSSNEYQPKKYIGFLLNFFEEKNRIKEPVSLSIDSARAEIGNSKIVDSSFFQNETQMPSHKVKDSWGGTLVEDQK